MKAATAWGRSRITPAAVFALGTLALGLAIAAVPLAVLSRQGSPVAPLIAAASRRSCSA
jgi:hypothetical protein